MLSKGHDDNITIKRSNDSITERRKRMPVNLLQKNYPRSRCSLKNPALQLLLRHFFDGQFPRVSRIIQAAIRSIVTYHGVGVNFVNTSLATARTRNACAHLVPLPYMTSHN